MNKTKEVNYYAYCDKCEYFEVDEGDDPCNECLTYFMNIDSHVPVNFKEKKGRKRNDER